MWGESSPENENDGLGRIIESEHGLSDEYYMELGMFSLSFVNHKQSFG